MEEALLRDYDHPIRLPVFEGPLDLLLFLIRKNEIDVYDIPIATVTDQYLKVLQEMKTLNLDVAGDFFVMAATLMYIKSRLLLPTPEQPAESPEEQDEGVDPRWELVQQLLEYRKVKEEASRLEDLIARAHDLLPRLHDPSALADDTPLPLKPTDRIALWNTFNQVLRRLAERLAVGQIHGEVVSVADRMEFLLQTLARRPSFSFSELFDQRPHVYTVVATFLALLELVRLRQVDIRQDENFAEIHCQRAAP